MVTEPRMAPKLINVTVFVGAAARARIKDDIALTPTAARRLTTGALTAVEVAIGHAALTPLVVIHRAIPTVSVLATSILHVAVKSDNQRFFFLLIRMHRSVGQTAAHLLHADLARARRCTSIDRTLTGVTVADARTELALGYLAVTIVGASQTAFCPRVTTKWISGTWGWALGNAESTGTVAGGGLAGAPVMITIGVFDTLGAAMVLHIADSLVWTHLYLGDGGEADAEVVVADCLPSAEVGCVAKAGHRRLAVHGGQFDTQVGFPEEALADSTYGTHEHPGEAMLG